MNRSFHVIILCVVVNQSLSTNSIRKYLIKSDYHIQYAGIYSDKIGAEPTLRELPSKGIQNFVFATHVRLFTQCVTFQCINSLCSTFCIFEQLQAQDS